MDIAIVSIITTSALLLVAVLGIVALAIRALRQADRLADRLLAVSAPTAAGDVAILRNADAPTPPAPVKTEEEAPAWSTAFGDDLSPPSRS